MPRYYYLVRKGPLGSRPHDHRMKDAHKRDDFQCHPTAVFGATFVIFAPAYRTVLVCIAISLASLTSSAAEDFIEWVRTVYRPVNAEMVALAPDGRHVAFSAHDTEGLSVIVIDLNNPNKKVKFLVQADREVPYSTQKQPAKLQMLAWATASRIVFGATSVFAANADGTDAIEIARREDFNQPQFHQLNPNIRLMGLIPEQKTQLLIEVPGRNPRQSEKLDIYVRRAAGGPVSQPFFNSPTRVDAPLDTVVYRVDVMNGKIARAATEQAIGRYAYNQRGEMQLLQVISKYSDTRMFRYRMAAGGWKDFAPEGLGVPKSAFFLTPDNYYGEHAYPLGIDFDRETFYVASNVGRDTFALEAFNLRRNERRIVAEDPNIDLAPNDPLLGRGKLIFDPRLKRLVGVRASEVAPIHWIDDEIRGWQRMLEMKFGASARILEWDNFRKHVLFRVSTGSQPGAYYVLDVATKKVTDFLRAAPWLDPAALNQSVEFSFTTSAGVPLTGYLTLPRRPRISPPPIVVYFPANFAVAGSSPFDPTAQVLAEMGMLVVRVNCRGTDGYGRNFRNAILQGVDRIPIDDALATVEWVLSRYGGDKSRIATYGQSFGGYLALRAIQLEPDRFRCAIAVNAPLDLERWLGQPRIDRADDMDVGIFDFAREYRRLFLQKGKPLDQVSVLSDSNRLTKPVYLITAAADPNDLVAAANRQLFSELKQMEHSSVMAELNPDFLRGEPVARADGYQRMLEFLNLNLYNFNVHIGEAVPVK
jgi:dipeptidyl aminopeptidase/acylaminoacyl peptidase